MLPIWGWGHWRVYQELLMARDASYRKEAKMISWVALVTIRKGLHDTRLLRPSLWYPVVTDSVLRSIQKNVLSSPGALVAENDKNS